MTTHETGAEAEASPEDLQQALEGLLLSMSGLPTVRPWTHVEFVDPKMFEDYMAKYATDPEDGTFFSLTKRESADTAGYDLVLTHPHISVHDQNLNFKDGRVTHKITTYLDHFIKPETAEIELSADGIQALHLWLTNPELKQRQEAIDEYYQKRHAQRTILGRALANLFKTDRPAYF